MTDKEERVEYRFNCGALMVHVRAHGRMVYGGREASLRELAAIFSVSASTFSRLDMNMQPDIETLCKLCGALNTDPGDFFTRSVWVVKES